MPVTDRLYENDSYIKEFTANVVCCLPAAEVFEGWQTPPEESAQAPSGGASAASAGVVPVGAPVRACADKPSVGAPAASADVGASGAAPDDHNTALTGMARGTWAAALERTAFFPEGGGQNADTGLLYVLMEDGSLCELKVYDVQIRDDVVYHRIDVCLAEGTKVTGKLDWNQRFSNMQQHSGEHIFSGLIHRHFGYDNVGFHLGSQAVTMDFNGPLTEADIDRIEWEVNEAIRENVAVTVSYPDRETLKTLEYRSKLELLGQVRIVTVEGYDVCACCAPHVAHTGEIGLLKVVDAKKYKGGMRISILCGMRALEDYRMKQSEGQKISRLLSAPVEAIGEAVAHQLEENTRLRQKIYELTQQLIMKNIENIPQGQENAWLFGEAMDAPAMRRTVNLAVERVEGYAGIFCGSDAEGYKYIIGTKIRDDQANTRDAAAAAKALAQALGARGGGSAGMAQGYVGASRAEIEKVLESL